MIVAIPAGPVYVKVLTLIASPVRYAYASPVTVTPTPTVSEEIPVLGIEEAAATVTVVADPIATSVIL